MSFETIVEPNARTSEPPSAAECDQTVLATRLEGDAVLVCSGELDLVTTPTLRRSLGRVLRLAPDRVVIDLSRVSFFDAGAIGEFVRARNAGRAAGTDLVVRSPSPFGRRLLDSVGLESLIIDEPHDPASALCDHVAELERTELLDPLTGLLTRRALDRDLVQSLAAATRQRQFLSVVMIDVEGLKAVNEEFGHAAGDDALRGVAGRLTSALRAGDRAYRIGGGAFVLLLPGLWPDDVDGVMERMALGADGAFSWGRACVKCDDRATPYAEQATHLLELAEQRILDYSARVRGGRGRADVALTSVAEPAEPSAELAGRFSAANRSNVVIEEAKGLIAERFDVGIDEAAIILRKLSAAQHQPLLAAAALVDRTVAVDLLAPHRPAGLVGADGDTAPDAHVGAGPGRN